MTKFLDKLERWFRPFALPNITLYLVIGQVIVFGLMLMHRLNPLWLVLQPYQVLHGQPWRLVTFIFVPPAMSPLFIAFAWYLFWIMGNTLEHYWGSARYCLFLFIGWLATVLVSFIAPYEVVSNSFLAGSVFLAFAYLNPNFELLLFFILPVAIKWMALITWLLFAWSFVSGDWGTRLSVLASVLNFFLFFGPEIVMGLKAGRRRHVARAEKEKAAAEPHHRCLVCGKTDLTHPKEDFRYCSKCAGAACYCEEHIQNHVHREVDPDED